MDYSIILKKGEVLLLWIYNNITNNFTSVFSTLKNKIPIISRYPLLKYSLIPTLIALFLALRYIIKFVINELAAFTSGFMGEAFGYTITERTIVISIAAVFIIIRIGLQLRNMTKKKGNDSELNYANTK
jgi:hypothetical protein